MRTSWAERAIYPLFKNGRAEITLGFILLVTSATLPKATPLNVMTQLIFIALIPLLRNTYFFALLPLITVAGLWINNYADHLLFSGFILYLAIEYAVSIKRCVTAAALSVQWLLLAYAITPEHFFTANIIPSLLLEGLLITVSVAAGHARFVHSQRHRLQHLAQQELEHELKTTIARYLHDSVARSLTTITVQAEIAQMATADPTLIRQLRDITTTGKVAILDLHQLVNHLIDTTHDDITGMLGTWNTASIKETITAAVTLLDKAGYTVTTDNIDINHRLPRPVETAFSLAFNEAVTNLVKHSPRHSPVNITVYTSSAEIKGCCCKVGAVGRAT